MRTTGSAAVAVVAIVTITACVDDAPAGLPDEFDGPFESTGATFEVGTAPSSSCVAGFSSDVLAVDAESGEVAWSRPVPWIADTDRVALAGDVLVGRSSADHEAAPYLFALDPGSGRPYWQRRASRLTTGPALAAFNGAFITSDGTDLVSYEPLTGWEQWRNPLGPGGTWAPVDDGVVVASGDSISKLEPSRGDIRWETTQPRGSTAVSSHAGLVLITGPERALLALDARTGDRRFELPANADREYIPLADPSQSGILFVGEAPPRSTTGRAASRPSEMHAVDTATGQILWTHRLEEHPGAVVIHPPVVVDTGETDSWTGLDRLFGGARWSFPLDVPHALVPLGNRRLLFVRNVVTGPGAPPPLRIESRAATDASLEWTYDLDAYHLGPVAVHGDIAVVSGVHPRRTTSSAPTASVLVAVNLADGEEAWSIDRRSGAMAATGLRWAGTLLVTRSDAPDACP